MSFFFFGTPCISTVKWQKLTLLVQLLEASVTRLLTFYDKNEMIFMYMCTSTYICFWYTISVY